MTKHIIKVIYCVSKKEHDFLLTNKDKLRLKKINSAKTKQNFIYSHSMLNAILINELNININDLDFKYNAYGKPYLSDNLLNLSGLFFSLSHTNNGIAVTLSKNAEVGIDIENRLNRKFESCQKLSKRFFNKDEQMHLIKLIDNQDDFKKYFFKIWTLKEAFLKSIGTGINTTLSDICFSVTSDEIRLNIINQQNFPHQFFYTTQINDFTISLSCATLKNCEIEIAEYY